MNAKSIFEFKDYLPVTINSNEDSIIIYFKEYDKDLTPIITIVAPGNIFGEVDGEQEYLSLHIENNEYSCYSNWIYSIYDEGSNTETNAILIRKVFSVSSIESFYFRIFNLDMPFYADLPAIANIKRPEEVFFEAFNSQGYYKENINQYDNDNYLVESIICFKNSKGDKIEVFYPEYEYEPGKGKYLRFDKEIEYTWVDFFEALIKMDVMRYPGIRLIED